MKVKKPDSKNANIVDVSDPLNELREAKNKAQDEIGYFIEHLKRFSSDEAWEFSVKSDFTQEGKHEHMWVNVESYENGLFKGKLGNDPNTIKGLKLGDSISVKKEDVEDWLFFDPVQKVSVGGYSIKKIIGHQDN